jgi:hypothetical protein
MFKDHPCRSPRSFWVYRSQQLVLSLEDRPGTLHSIAAPPPEGVPQHPFLHGVAYDALSEHDLGTLLRQSISFDQYLLHLIAAGYDLMSAYGVPALRVETCWRIEQEGRIVGALWKQGGQFTTLGWQPAVDEFIFSHGTLTVYDQEAAPILFDALKATNHFEALQQQLPAHGFRLTLTR